MLLTPLTEENTRSRNTLSIEQTRLTLTNLKTQLRLKLPPMMISVPVGATTYASSRFRLLYGSVIYVYVMIV